MKSLTTFFHVISTAIIVLILASCAATSNDESVFVEAVDVEETAKPVESEKVVITGSRIKRSESEDASPVEVIDELLMEPTVKNVLKNQRILTPEEGYQIFRQYGVNPTINTLAKPHSTFSMDVDNGSYKLVKQMLSQGRMPHADGIRVEEFVNGLRYQYRQTSELLSMSAEVTPSPFRKGYHVLHLGVQVKQVADHDRLPTHIVMVVDVSGSMKSDNKLDLLKSAMKTLVSQLNKDDKVAIVAYSDTAKIVLPSTQVKNRRKINRTINALTSGGGTNAEQGLRLGYQLANKQFEVGFNNRVILTSDGMANVGSTSPEAILKEIVDHKERGIFLTTVGVGVGMYNDYLLEQLANKGNGHYIYIGDQDDIQESFVDHLSQQLQTMVKDAKVQVEFNPNTVSRYRLLGYENRALSKEDFLDRKKDGGELSAGHRVTALYEVKLNDNHQIVDSTSAQSGGLGEFRISYKKPLGKKVFVMKKQLPLSIIRASFANTSSDTKLSLAVAAFAEKLRQSYWSRYYSYDDIYRVLLELPESWSSQSQVQELKSFVHIAGKLDARDDRFSNEQSLKVINFDSVPLLQ